jgi:septal ring factor EnvC (AmiA/AmiB activator)
MRQVFSIFFILGIVYIGTSQTGLQKKLEQKRQILQQEILQINRQLLKTKHNENNALLLYRQIKRKIAIRKKLIRNLRREINEINRAIRNNENQSKRLTTELKQLKQDYARMIRQSYNSRSRNNKLYFLFSSESFQQAFKRMQYLKQYSKYRKKQALLIEQKQQELVRLKQQLKKQKADKQKIRQNYQQEIAEIKKEEQKQQTVVDNIKRKKNKYIKQIKAKQKERARIDKLIDELIKKAIAKSNKKAGKSQRHASKFFLTPEGKKLANKFSANRGALPWPVKKAYISRHFGKQQHEIFKNVKVESSGIYLATEPNSKVRAVFEGKVLQIQLIPGGNNTVFIKHGNYLTIYGNLKEVYVKPGQKVKTRQEIGKVATDKNGKTELKFRVYKNMTKLDPEKWLLKK